MKISIEMQTVEISRLNFCGRFILSKLLPLNLISRVYLVKEIYIEEHLIVGDLTSIHNPHDPWINFLRLNFLARSPRLRLTRLWNLKQPWAHPNDKWAIIHARWCGLNIPNWKSRALTSLLTDRLLPRTPSECRLSERYFCFVPGLGISCFILWTLKSIDSI